MAKFQTKAGERSSKVLKQVTALRNKGMAWRAIAAQLEVAPRTVRRIFDEANGEGAHFQSRLEGKGGRTRQTA
jgi:orotate phosphoribosyltransferase-like protein